MKRSFPHRCIFRSTFFCLIFAANSALPQSGCNTCDGKIRIRGTLHANGSLSGLPVDTENNSGSSDARPYLANKGTEYTLTMSPTGPGSSSISLSTCEKSLYYKKKEWVYGEWDWPERWQLGSSLTMHASRDEGTGGGNQNGNNQGGGNQTGSTCGCAGCQGGEDCRCCCYQEGSTSDMEVATSYLAWTVKHEYINTNPDENPDWAAQYDALSSQEGFLGLSSNPGEHMLKLDFKDFENTEEVPWDYENDPIPSPNEPDKFYTWGANKITITTVTPTVYCTCGTDEGGGGEGNTNGGNEGGQNGSATTDTATEALLIAWNPPDSPVCDVGASGAQGPSMSGQAKPGQSSKAPLRLEFGLGRNTEGAASAAFFFSTDLDEADPIKGENFKLMQPFHKPHHGTPPIQIVQQPAQGGPKLLGNGLLVTETRSENTVSLCFYDTSLPGTLEQQLCAVHTLQQTPETAEHDPGIIHTVEQNGQTKTWQYQGKAQPDGGRTWKEIDPEGNGADLTGQMDIFLRGWVCKKA